MFKKLTKFGLPALVLGAALFATPGAALARDHDRDHWRHERHEHVWRERGPRFGVYFGPSYTYGPGYGYYDAWGAWHPYRSYGYYDRWGRFHPY